MRVDIRNVCKCYNDKKVLDNVSFVCESGECTVIMGASGCGKTTLLRIIMGLEKADYGEIIFGNDAPVKFSAVFQEDRLFENLTVMQNITMVLEKRKSVREDVVENLRAVGMGGCLNRRIAELSGGMKRRVAIVRAVMADSDILIADEPFKGLDECTKEYVIKYFVHNTDNKTVIVVTHDEKEADNLGNHILLNKLF